MSRPVATATAMAMAVDVVGPRPRLATSLDVPATEIVPRLFLGGVVDANRSASAYDAVVNCTPDFPFYGASAHRLRVPVLDNDPANAAMQPSMLREAVAFVRDHLAAGRTVLVHCVAGQQRSPAVVAAYLVDHFHLTVDEAIEFVRKRRSVAFFGSVNFRPSLDAFAHPP